MMYYSPHTWSLQPQLGCKEAFPAGQQEYKKKNQTRMAAGEAAILILVCTICRLPSFRNHIKIQSIMFHNNSGNLIAFRLPGRYNVSKGKKMRMQKKTPDYDNVLTIKTQMIMR